MANRPSRLLALGAAAALLLASGAATAHDPAMHAGHQGHAAMLAKQSAFQRSRHHYRLPEVTLRDQAGRAVAVRDLEQNSEPLAVNFIFATCTTICPVMSATFAHMLSELGPDADRVRLVSITIDPEHDTTPVLAEYAQRFDAPASWSFLTGTRGDVERVLRAFDAWSGSKATHRPITMLRRQGAHEWVRLDGLGSGAELARQVRAMLD